MTDAKQPAQEEIDAQATADGEAFSAGFDSVRQPDSSQEEPAPDVKPEAGNQGEEGKEPTADEALFAGLTATELKGLLAKSAQVDSLEASLRKEHGKLGELNAKIDELMKGQATPPAAPHAADEELAEQELANDYPDIAKLADLRARKIVDEAMKGVSRETIDPQAVADEVETRVQHAVNKQLMTYMHSDWEGVIASDDYKVWLATQPKETQERATTTPRAAELAPIVAGFKTWKGGVAERGGRNRERLEAGLTPKGVQGGAPQVTPNELDEFRAGFRSVRGN